MADGLIDLFTQQFSTMLLGKLQQQQSKLRGRVMEGTHTGNMASPVQYIGPVQAKAPAGRFSLLNYQQPTFTRRWVDPVDKEIPLLIDTFDQLKTIVDPKSQYSTESAYAANREYDDRLIAAAFGDAKIGGDAGSLTTETWASFSSAWTIADTFGSGSTSSGLTVAKMREAKRVMRKAQVDVDAEQLTWVTSSQGESDLLAQATVTSGDFNDRPVLTDGKVVRFMGFDVLYSERLSSSSNKRKNIVFVKSGLYLGVWLDMQTRIDQAVWLSSQPWQVYTKMSSGATRLEPGRVLEVDCADTSAAADVTP